MTILSDRQRRPDVLSVRLSRCWPHRHRASSSAESPNLNYSSRQYAISPFGETSKKGPRSIAPGALFHGSGVGIAGIFTALCSYGGSDVILFGEHHLGSMSHAGLILAVGLILSFDFAVPGETVSAVIQGDTGVVGAEPYGTAVDVHESAIDQYGCSPCEYFRPKKRKIWERR